MPTLRAELESLLQAVVTPADLERALHREPWAAALLPSLLPVESTPPEQWFSRLTQLTDQHGVEGELLRLLETLRPARAAEFQALAARLAAGTIRHNLPDDPPTPLADPRDRYALLLRERVGALPDVFQVAGGPATVESVYVAVRLSGESRALDCETEAAFGGAHLGAQRHIGDRTGRRAGPEHPEPLETVLRRPHTRWVLLGDPGSGKTTVLRHAALKLLDDPDGRLPIYLTVAEIEDGIEPALRRLFERFGAADLTRWAHKEILEGRAVLLLDGLDEVADLPAARDALLKLAMNVGRTTTLVIASRPTGYKALSIDFVTLALCPLGVGEQRELLSRWVADDARVTAALARLSRTPRLRRLAENPLLLTLAGLVLRAGKDVPQRRAELYELALDVLVHRRHAPDGLVGPQLSAPGLAMELLGWAALRLHGQEGDVYPRGALIAALEADPHNRGRLQKQWGDPESFIAEVVTRSGLLIPDTGRVEDARAFSFPHRTFREFLAATALERDMGAWAAGLGARVAAPKVEGAVAVEAPKAAEPTALATAPPVGLWASFLAWARALFGLSEEVMVPVAEPSPPPVMPPPPKVAAPPAPVAPPRVSELARVLDEGKARPERWAEVLALTCGRLGPGGADALVRRITEEANSALLLRVVADAEGISADTVRGTLKLELGWQWEQLQARQKVIVEIPALVKDLAVAVGLLEQVARATTCGHDLFWVREVLRRIERGDVEGGVLEGTVEDAKRAAKGAADNVLSHLDLGERAKLLALLKPWWRTIPAGSFDMGSTEYPDEKPIHRVTFTSGCHMLGVPVTWAMYRLFDPGHDAARETFGGKLPPEAQDELPVYTVSWFAAVMFAEWAGAQLPLEPEWEYACRAGTKTRYWSGDTEADLARVGWVGQNSDGQPHPVAQKPKNAWGLHDVHGNVYEWCAEAYDGEAYAARADGLTVDPRGLTKAVGKTLPMSAESADRGAPHVLRGGSWGRRPGNARSANRDRNSPSRANSSVGFRLLLCPPGRP